MTLHGTDTSTHWPNFKMFQRISIFIFGRMYVAQVKYQEETSQTREETTKSRERVGSVSAGQQRGRATRNKRKVDASMPEKLSDPTNIFRYASAQETDAKCPHQVAEANPERAPNC